MNPWLAKAVILLGGILVVAIPAAVHHRAEGNRVLKRRKTLLDSLLLALVWLGFLLSIIWVATPVLAFADHVLHPVPFVAGLWCMALGLWLLYRSHSDLGRNWSLGLEVRERHELVTWGVYRRVRHPMYLALLLYSLGQALLVPNWVAGPSYFVALALLSGCRFGAEEKMLLEEFGAEYRTYMARTKRLVPGLW